MMRWAPHVRSIPWVARYCPDDEDPAIPIMSRERYREVLRHLWLRGVDGMQVFNPTRRGFSRIVLSEVQDAVAVYDEMLEHREFLESGDVMNLDVPGPEHDGVVWSGLRSGNQAVVRVFRQGKGEGTVTIEPWIGRPIELDVPSKGQTYLLRYDGTRVTRRSL